MQVRKYARCDLCGKGFHPDLKECGEFEDKEMWFDCPRCKKRYWVLRKGQRR